MHKAGVELPGRIRGVGIVNAERFGVTPGNRVTLRFQSGTIRTFTITSHSQSAAPEKGIISDQSPLGAALLGKTIGETVTYAVGAEKLSVEVVAVLSAQELLSIVCTLPRTTEAELHKRLEQWHLRWNALLEERTPCSCCPEKKWPYTHRRLRTAYRSLKTNLPYLFTYQKYSELKLPNTTNSLDGMFSQLKNRLAVHRGLRRHRRYKLICEILRGRKK